MAWINFTDFTGNSATFPGDYLVGYIGVQEQRYPVVALKNGLSAGLFTAQNLLVTEDTTIRGNLSVFGTSSVFETIVSVTSALSVINTGTGPALTVKQTGVQPIALFLDDNNNTFRIDDDFKVSFFNSHAIGQYSVAEGDNTVASGQSSHAEGGGTDASGNYSHAQGLNTDASGNYSNAQGHATTASGEASHAEGYITIASGQGSHAEGNNTMASGGYSHAEGNNTMASAGYSHAEGYATATGRRNAFATYTAATKTFTFAPAVSANFAYVTPGALLRGRENVVLNDYFTITVASRNIFTGTISAVAAPFGSNSTTGYLIDSSGDYSHAEGSTTTASGQTSHAEGNTTTASGQNSHAEGNLTIASGQYSHAEGSNTTASGDGSHAEGGSTNASGDFSHAEGNGTSAEGQQSHAEGLDTVAEGGGSHAEGYETRASGLDSHAEGSGTKASGDYSHTEGYNTRASGVASHAEGDNTFASGNFSHAEGEASTASGESSHAEGFDNVTGRRNNFLTYTAAAKTFTFANTVSANFAYVTPGTLLRGYDNDVLGGNWFTITVASRSLVTGAISATADAIGNNSTDGYLIDNGGAWAHAEGYSNTASGEDSHAEGYNNVASGNESHAEGYNNVASGQYSHAQGNTVVASGESSHAGGQGTLASGLRSTATGQFTSATKTNAYASGKLAYANHNRSWVWQGTSLDDTAAQFVSTRTDQFAIRAANGFYLSGAMGINTDSIQNALTVNGSISGNSGVAVNTLTGRNISLVHTPANDGTNAFIQLGEFTTGSTTASAFSGFRFEYDENTNAFNLSSIFGATTTDVININNSGNVTANSTTIRGTLSASGNVNGNQADFTNTTVRGILSASGYTLCDGLTAANSILSNTLTSRNISLVHSPANDGTNSYIQLGEFTTGSTTASAFSGFRLEYNENTNAFNLSSIFGATTTDVININNSGNVTANSTTIRGTLSASGNVNGNQADFTNTTVRGILSASTGVFGNTSIFGSLSVLSPNYNSLITRGVSALAADSISSIINSRVGIETVPLTSYSLHIRGGNLRVDGVDYSNVPNITSFDTDGQSLFDLRSAFVGSNYSLSIAESGLGNFMKFFGGRTGDEQPFIVTKAGSPLRFATFNSYYDGASFSEKVRIGGNGNLSVGLGADGNEKVTVLGNISASGSLIGNSLTSRNISLLHSPANDGANPYIQLGELTTGSTTASAFSGFRFEYNEPTNTLGLSSILGSTITNVLNVDPYTSITPYTVSFTPFTSGGTGNFITNATPGTYTIVYPPALSGVIPSSELSTRLINNKGAIDGVLFFANSGTQNSKQYILEFAKDAAFATQNTAIYRRASGETAASIMRPVNGSFANGTIVMPNANATQPWGTNGSLVSYKYTAGDSLYYRIGFAYPSEFELMGLSAGYIRILP